MMKKVIYMLILLITALKGKSFAQNVKIDSLIKQVGEKKVIATKSSLKTLKANDTTYLRILNGTIINNDYIIKDFERISIKSKEEIANFGVIGNKPLMIIGTEIPGIEHKIHSILYSRPNFIKNYKYPLDIRLPISINNKLVINDEKWRLLSKITLKDIIKIEYLDNQSSKVNRKVTPFGIINLKVK